MNDSSYVKRIRTDQSPSWKRSGPLLSSLDMELTERCNNNCIHCAINRAADDQNAKNKELSTQDIKRILLEAAGLGCLTVKFTGGEPLLRNDFEEIYCYARNLGLKVLLFTNATLLKPPLAKLFARTPPIEPVEVSVYGMKKSSCEAVTRTPGSFESAWDGIHLLIEHKIPFCVKSAVLPPNEKDIEELERWVKSIPLITDPPSYSLFYDLSFHPDSINKKDAIRKYRLPFEAVLKILLRNQESYLKEMEMFCSKFIAPPGDRLLSCGAGLGSGCIDAYGRFQPCLLLRSPHTSYNLNCGSLTDALTRFFPEIRKMTPVNPDYLERCARCFLKGLCLQCPAKSWLEHGTMDTPVEYLCNMAHAHARHLGLLNDHEIAWEVYNWQERIKTLSIDTSTPKGLFELQTQS